MEVKENGGSWYTNVAKTEAASTAHPNVNYNERICLYTHLTC